MVDPKCPKCGLDCVLITDDADIGVGIQVHVLGWDCSHCGPLSACFSCGSLEDSHQPWCKEVQDLE